MPHVTIKHWPRTFTDAEKADLAASVTDAVTRVFGVEPGSVSIAVEPVERSRWLEEVYAPEIDRRPGLLWKRPGYTMPVPATPVPATPVPAAEDAR